MTRDSRETIISLLQQDEIKNLNLLYFMEQNPVHQLDRIGNSVILRGESDRRWVYISSPNEIEETNLKSMHLAMKLGFQKDRRVHWFEIQ